MTISKLAVFGNPVVHSRSPQIHQAFARQAGLKIDYQRLLAPEDGFEASVRDFVNAGGVGFNVTLPFKEQAWRLVDERSPGAEATGAVNTVAVTEAGMAGYNTDGPGLVTDLLANRGWPVEQQRILVIGAGGAVRGVLWAMLQQDPESIDIYNRTPARAETLVDHYDDARLRPVTEPQHEYHLVINGTSAGIKGEPLALPDHIVGVHTRCYDMSYGAGVTPFNRWAQDHGCPDTADGLGMLVEQAALAFSIWFGFNADTKAVISELRTTLIDSGE